MGRQGTTGALRLDKAGVQIDDRERLHVDASYRTQVEHIYAVGDVIGFPALASTAMEQGRLAACHAYGAPACSIPELFPYGIYAIPEISMVGRTEDQLTKAGIPYEAGVAQYKELARGQLLGDEEGMLPRTLLRFGKPGPPEERPTRRTVETARDRVTICPLHSNRHPPCSHLESELESPLRDNGPDDHSSCYPRILPRTNAPRNLFPASLSSVMGKWPSQGRRRT